jgi:hypothetical protein
MAIAPPHTAHQTRILKEEEEIRYATNSILR